MLLGELVSIMTVAILKINLQIQYNFHGSTNTLLHRNIENNPKFWEGQ